MNFWGRILASLFLAVSANADELCKTLWSGQLSQAEEFTFISMGPYQIIPEEFGNVTKVVDIGFETGKFTIGTDTGFFVSKKPSFQNSTVETGFLKPSQPEDNLEAFTTMLVAQPTQHFIKNILVEPTDRLHAQLVVSRGGVKLIKSNGETLDLPYSNGAFAAQWSPNGIVVAFQERIRLYDTNTLEIKKQITPLNKFTAMSINPVRDEIVAGDGLELVVITNFQDRKVVKELKSPATAMEWNLYGTAYYMIHPTTLAIFDGQHQLKVAEPIDSPVYSIAWDVSGDNLAMSTDYSVWTYQLSTRTSQMVLTTNSRDRNPHTVTWFNRDGILATVGAIVENGAKKWEVALWDIKMGIELPTSVVISADALTTPPSIAGIRGSILNGSSRFYIVTADGQLYEMNEVLQVSAPSTFIQMPNGRLN